MVDPPSGWRYGFPKPYDHSKTYEQQLEENNYPDWLMNDAMKHSRWWYEEEKEIG